MRERATIRTSDAPRRLPSRWSSATCRSPATWLRRSARAEPRDAAELEPQQSWAKPWADIPAKRDAGGPKMLARSALAAAVALLFATASLAASPYKPPRLSDGHPSLEGYWNNGTLTRMERDPKYGDRQTLTPEELATIEHANDARSARLNAPTPQTKGVDDLNECQSGAQGAACGYNAGWTDPGNRVMRVGGQPRTSLITFPANGRMPKRLPGAPAIRRFAESENGPAGRADNPEERSLGERCIMSFGVSSGPVMTSQLYNNSYQFVQTPDHLAIWVEMVHDVRIVPIGGKHRTDGVHPYMGDSIGWWDGDTLVVE